MEKIVMFKDYGNVKLKRLFSEKDFNIWDVIKQIIKDYKGKPVYISEVPAEYWEKYGITVTEVEGFEQVEDVYAGVCSKCMEAECRNCSSFEEGSCFRYGGIVSPDAKVDCVHGDEIYRLIYDDQPTGYLIYMEEEVTALEAAKTIAAAYDKSLREVAEESEDTYKSWLWKLEKTV